MDNFDDLAGAAATKPGSRNPRRMMTATISVACAGILAGVVLWRVETRRGAPAQIAAPVATAAAPPAEPTAAPPTAPAAEPTAAPPTAPAAEPTAALAAAPVAEPTAALAAAPVAEPTAALAAAPVAAGSQPAPSSTAATHAVPLAPAPAPVVAPPPPTAGASEGDDLRAACKRAAQQHRGKDVLATCGQAFEASPQSADIAVILAKTEFDRGRDSQAMTWAKKAVAIDPGAADAYVFIGGAEQNAGHSQAAKVAYQRYLQLAPTGRYAVDLRAVLKSL